MSKILLTGATGQVGWELQRALICLGEVIPVGRNSPIPDLRMDLANPDSICQIIREVKPDLIVNAAAYTAVDKAEAEPELAQAVNGTAPGILAEEVKRLGSALIHYSTDYVFDGRDTTPFAEQDQPNPINVYGKTKLVGEQAIQAVDVPHLILRTSWVYGLRGKNFLLTMLKLSQEREELKIVNDQFGAPTWCRMIAAATAQILAQANPNPVDFLFQKGGLYHLTAQGQTSWYGFTKSIFELRPADRTLQRLIPIPSAEYQTAAARPTFSILDNRKVLEQFNLKLPNWQTTLELALG